MHPKQFGAIALGVLGIAGTIAGCGASPAATGPSTSAHGIHQVVLWESHAGGPVANTEAALVSQFNKSHPKIHVSINVTKASTKALAALTAGNPPLLAEISHYDGNFLAAHALKSFNPYIHGANGLSPTQIKDIYPGIWSNGAVNGQHYRIEIDTKVSDFLYNKALFAKAGISSPPKTWNQLAFDLKKLKKLPGIIPMAFKDSSAHILPPFMANGGQLFKPGSQQKQVAFNSPAGIRTFNYFRSLYKNGDMILAHGTAIRADLASGKLAIADGTSAGYQKAMEAVNGKFPLGAFAYPVGSSGHSANMLQGLGFVMMVDHNPSDYQAAWTFIKWFLAGKQQAYWAKHSGFAPETTQALPYFSASYLKKYPGMAVSIQTVQSPYTVPRPTPDSYNEVDSVLDAAFFNAVTGKQTTSQALKSLQQQANKYLSGQTAL